MGSAFAEQRVCKSLAVASIGTNDSGRKFQAPVDHKKKIRHNKPKLLDEGLGRFARAFKSEAELWDKLAELFRRMGRERVRVTHGTQEHGRDIVFYGPGGLGTALYACVVKNDRITGEAGSTKSVRTVIDQAKEAFQYPYVNPDNGQEEQVRQIFVLSPHDCTSAAQECISAQLKGFGAVEFCCGSALLDLFSKHWQSFFVESNVLASYLTALRVGLQNDAPLIKIILQKPGVLADIPADFERMYVPQDFGQTIRQVSVGEIDEPLELPSRELRIADINAFLGRVAWLRRLLEYARHSANLALASVAKDTVTAGMDALERSVQTEWRRAFQEKAAKAREDFERTFDKKLKHGHAAPPPIREQDVQLRLERQESGIAQSSLLVDEFRELFRSVLNSECAKINDLKERRSEDREWLASTEFRAYCGLLDLSESFPEAIHFGSEIRQIRLDSSFADAGMQMTLISGPAGFGKSSFCRSQALSCAEELLANSGHSLPVMVPLHKFTAGIPATADEAFFDSPELRMLLKAPPPDTSVLLFLDGLDEVPNATQQRKIIELARQAVAASSDDLRVIVTARDHIVGPWLNDVPRLNVLPLTEAQQLTLAEHWLGSPNSAQAFFLHLQDVSPLRPLMEAPLLATLILAVYKKQGFLPPNRTALYDLFIELLCGGWDAAKEIQRHDHFGIHDKRLVLVELAGRNHLNESRDATDNDFRAAIRTSLKGLLPHSDDLLIELRHDGLLVTTAAGVRFRHLSFQEYLAAEFLHGDQSGQRAKPILRRFYGGDDWWRDVLAFYVTRTSNPTSMEDWLIKQAILAAKSLNSAYVHSLELDQRLSFLRRALREAFPSYNSKYPKDGVVSESIQRGTQVVLQRRTLAGVRIE